MSTVIAHRMMDLSVPAGARAVVTIKQPQRDGNDYRCEFHIVGLGDKAINSYGMGVDSMQALILTIQLIGALLYASDEAKHGRISWLGMKNLGFPVPEVVADLVPEP
jgi:hypothetical protein